MASTAKIKMHTKFWYGNLKERHSMESFGWIILKRIFQKVCKGVWVSSHRSAEEPVRAVVNTAMNVRVTQKARGCFD